MTVKELPDRLKAHWTTIRKQLLDGTYGPMPVKRVDPQAREAGSDNWASRRFWTASSSALWTRLGLPTLTPQPPA